MSTGNASTSSALTKAPEKACTPTIRLGGRFARWQVAAMRFASPRRKPLRWLHRRATVPRCPLVAECWAVPALPVEALT